MNQIKVDFEFATAASTLCGGVLYPENMPSGTFSTYVECGLALDENFLNLQSGAEEGDEGDQIAFEKLWAQIEDIELADNAGNSLPAFRIRRK